MVLRRRMRLLRPGDDIALEAARTYGDVLRDGDFVVFSDKAVAVSLGLVADESGVGADPLSRLAAFITCRLLWGRLLGVVALRPSTRRWLMEAPLRLLAAHKRLALRVGGLLQALKPMSEAGVDASNLPGTLVSLPIPRPGLVARLLALRLRVLTGRRLRVLIVDSDRCYRPRGLRVALASRPTEVRGLVNLGVIAYTLARLLKPLFKPYATPVGYHGPWPGLGLLLRVAELADRARGYGAGRDVFEMSRRLNAPLTGVTWEMLEHVEHYPVVVVRVKRTRGRRNGKEGGCAQAAS